MAIKEDPLHEPKRRYGHGLLGAYCLSPDERWLVTTVPQAWSLALPQFGRPPRAVHKVTTLEEDVVSEEVNSLPEVDAVMGIGGGTALDFAKYVAWRRSLPLVLAPSITSCNACMTSTIAIRRHGRMHPVGEIFAREVVVDFDVVCAAPAHMNSAGVVDLLSSHTALKDWELVGRDALAPYSADAASDIHMIVAKLRERSQEIREGRPAGVLALTEIMWLAEKVCRIVETHRPLEGSEHIWARNLEYQMSNTYRHGPLIATGILLMSALQGNDLSAIRQMLNELGALPKLKDLPVSSEDLKDSLVTARKFAAASRVVPTVLSEKDVTPDVADELIRQVFPNAAA